MIDSATQSQLDWIYAAISQELNEHLCADFDANAEIIAEQHDLLAKVARAYCKQKKVADDNIT